MNNDLTNDEARTIEAAFPNVRDHASQPTDYLVTIFWGAGMFAQIDVPTFQGPEAAARRAWLAGNRMGWFDLPYGEVGFEVYDESLSETEPVLVIEQA